MDQYELLWQYQQVDIEVDRFEREIRSNPKRLKLIKNRDFLVEQQGVIKRIESEVTIMTDRLEALCDEVTRLRENINDISLRITESQPDSLDATRSMIITAQKLISSITRYESELTKLRKEADVRDKQQHEIRVRAAKTKAEFDQLKKSYDTEYRLQTTELDKLKEQATQAANSILPEIMMRYNNIKRHSMPPMAHLNEDRCGGCNMALPQAVLHKVRAGSTSVECENCGRILLVKK